MFPEVEPQSSLCQTMLRPHTPRLAAGGCFSQGVSPVAQEEASESRGPAEARVRCHLEPARSTFDGQGHALWQSLLDLALSSRLAPSHAPHSWFLVFFGRGA